MGEERENKKEEQILAELLENIWNSNSNEPIPTVLYHYCTVDAFMGIIKSKKLRLSNLWHVNDSMEMLWGRNKIYSIFKEIFKTDITYQIHNEYMLNNKSAYASCFSEIGDLLSQWRAYADDGTGISIGFDLNQFEINKGYPFTSSVFDHSVKINKIIYSEVDQDKIISNILLFLKNTYISDDLQHHLSSLGRFAPFFKNPAFEEEKEWRIVFRDLEFKVILPEESEIKESRHLGNPFFINKKGLISEYYEFSFEKYLTKYPIKEIILGPKCKLELDYVPYFLSNNGIDVEDLINRRAVYKSKASYR